MRVLIVEDERSMALYIAQALAEHGFATDIAHDGEEAWTLIETHPYDVVVLDLMLPRLDGLEVCRRMRQAGNHVPILVLSARDLVDDRVKGLNAGADDYLVKPFAIEELTARLHALLRRQPGTAKPLLSVSDLHLDPATHAVRRGEQAIPLTAREYSLLEYLMRHPGVVHTRTMIAEHVWDFPFDHASNVVDVYVKHLRGKIDSAGRRSFITAVRGVGYVLDDPDATGAS